MPRSLRFAWPMILLAAFAPGCSTDEQEADLEPERDADDVAVGDSDAADAGSGAPDAVADTAPTGPIERVVLDDVRISSWDTDPNFQNALGTFSFEGGPWAEATLIVELRSPCFPLDWVRTGAGVPDGHNWPEECDAFDRNFEVTLNDPNAEGDPPALELVRAITPFGGPMTIETDITDYANFLTGEQRLRVHITTWSDGAGQVSGAHGGWDVSARVELVPGEPPREVLAIVPLLNVGHGPIEAWPAVDFEVPEGTTEARIEYRTTGHGGGSSAGQSACIGPADEFCRRYHHVSIDGRDLGVWQPWRSSCEDLCDLVSSPFEHCEQNPCGAIESVRAPRANWCPGDVTGPEIFEDASLTTPGTHTFGHLIEGAGEGSYWRTSATYFAWGD